MRKFLIGLILFVSVFVVGKQAVLQASVIDSCSPWGVGLWRYSDDPSFISQTMDTVVSLGCSWVRLSGFGMGEWSDPANINFIDRNTDRWIDAAHSRNLNVVLAAWPNPIGDSTDNYSDDILKTKYERKWSDFWGTMASVVSLK